MKYSQIRRKKLLSYKSKFISVVVTMKNQVELLKADSTILSETVYNLFQKINQMDNF